MGALPKVQTHEADVSQLVGIGELPRSAAQHEFVIWISNFAQGNFDSLYSEGCSLDLVDLVHGSVSLVVDSGNTGFPIG